MGGQDEAKGDLLISGLSAKMRERQRSIVESNFGDQSAGLKTTTNDVELDTVMKHALKRVSIVSTQVRIPSRCQLPFRFWPISLLV